MSAHKAYPRLGGIEKIKKHGGQCACCDGFSRFRVDVQTSWFRGDDEVYFVCENHKPTGVTLSDFLDKVEAKAKLRRAEAQGV